jgi:catechol 2,3-dioxygenase-like lactoylglutathione lyase family enzyme
VIHFGSVIPVLRILDIAKAREFYFDYLGFTLDWEHRFGDNFPVYWQVSRGACQLHLTEHHGDANPGSYIRCHVADLDALHRELSGKDYRYSKPQVELMPWGQRELQVTDPFKNKIVFFESQSSSEPAPS